MNLQDLRRRLEPALRGLFHLYWRFARGMTLGVRAVVVDAEGRVFLIKHSYISGWHLPGGGVEVGETLRDALKRECKEQAKWLPELPTRTAGLLSKYDAKYLEKRRRALQRWLEIVMLDRVWGGSEALREWVLASD